MSRFSDPPPARGAPAAVAAMDPGGRISDKVLDEMPPCSSAQEAPRRRRRRSKKAARGFRLGRSRVLFRRNTRTRSRLEIDAGVSVWAGLHQDILGVVLRFLPCLADRARARSVCRHWRAVGRRQVLPPPLPILVLPEFKFSSLSVKGNLAPVWRVPVPKEMPGDDLRCVGSFDSWLVCVTRTMIHLPEYYYRPPDYDCFLVNVFSRKVIRLPQRPDFLYNFSAGHSRGILRMMTGTPRTMSFCQVVLSNAPDSGSNYIVAASNRGCQQLAVWHPGNVSWHICSGRGIDGPIDLAFYQGKLYVLRRSKPCLFACELEVDDPEFIVSHIELCLTELPCNHPFQEGGDISCNMVVWRGELLLIIRHDIDNSQNRKVLKVEVFAVDVNSKPYGLTEIHSFNGDCIFVGSGGCKPFPAGLYSGFVGDLIYFVPDDFKPHDRFVYSMRDGRMRPFAAKLLDSYFAVPEGRLNFPVWLLPSDDAAEQT